MEAKNLIPYHLLPYQWLSHARALGFLVENEVVNRVTKILVKSARPGNHHPTSEKMEIIRARAVELIERDASAIRSGLYPPTVLIPESPLSHLFRLPGVFFDSVRAARLRHKGRTTVFSGKAQEFLDELPRYYRRNFHFQNDGYLSEHSAELYEHQVEILFGGLGDPMRRMILGPLKERFESSHPEGQGLKFLEVGTGTGRGAYFLSLAFPKAQIFALDLSTPYLKTAQNKLRDRSRVHFIQGDAASLPFQDNYFDAVVSIFMFHELPFEERKKIVSESKRVLKEGGLVGLVDSLQLKDAAEFKDDLEGFPEAFHEPFYRNYIENPMEAIFEEQGLSVGASGTGFFAKFLFGKKASKS